MEKDTNMIFDAELGLCLNELSMSESFIKDVLRKMAVKLSEEKEKKNPESKRLSYYAQLTHSVILNLQAAQDALSAISLLMAQNSKDE